MKTEAEIRMTGMQALIAREANQMMLKLGQRP